MGQRFEMAADRRDVASFHRTGERRHRLLTAQVLERPLHQWAQRLPRLRVRQPGMPEQALGYGLDHDEVIGSEYGARVIDRLGLGRDVRSEERRVGKECRSRWSTYHEK